MTSRHRQVQNLPIEGIPSELELTTATSAGNVKDTLTDGEGNVVLCNFPRVIGE